MPCFLLPFFDILGKMCMWGNGYFKYPFEILAMVQVDGFRLMGSGLGSAWREILRLSSHCSEYA